MCEIADYNRASQRTVARPRCELAFVRALLSDARIRLHLVCSFLWRTTFLHGSSAPPLSAMARWERCYDELTLSQPDLIRGIHHEYLHAGAEIVETNTFGANAFRLGRHSLADKVQDVNKMGGRLAREAAKSFDVGVGAWVGPLGT